MALEERFFKHVEKTDGCWLWKGAKQGEYPSFRVGNGVTTKAHRFSFEIANRKLESGECVLHSCDNPNCVNPAHLRAGTRGENNSERAAKGRNAPPPTQKISPQQAIEIRNRYIPQVVTQNMLALEYQLSRRAIRSIISGKNWRSLWA